MADRGRSDPPSSAFLAWAPQAAMLSAVVAVSVLPLMLTGAMAVRLQSSLGFGEGELGASFAVFFGTAAVSSTVLGEVSERLGAIRSLRIGSLVAAVVLLGIAVLAHSWASLVALLAVAGIGSALTRPAASLYIARLITPSRQGLAFGINHSSVPIATLVAGLVVPTVALTVGWRWGFVVGAVLAVLALVGVPRGHDAEGTRMVADRADDLPPRLLVLLAASMALGTAGASSLGAFSVPTIVDAGLGEGAAGLLYAAASVAGLVSRVAVGWLADRREAGHLQFVAGMLLVGAVAFVLMGSGRLGLVVVAVPLASASAWAFLGVFNLAIVRMNPAAPAAATGVTQAGAFVGGVAGPWGLGELAESGSFAMAWLVAGGLTLLAVGTVLHARSLVRGRGRIDLPPAPGLDDG